ncbi:MULTISPECIES: hypothetical protein [Fusobacterium]|jgi:hypothetical protein|uniref:Uncharacterized protein n=1 Tax=Fusobacterium canifelinum TaxID=285729 RepID=A0ABX7CIT1_9FUSO|nr:MULTISPECIES: hypothetical protein [Fusobacterium]QQS88482.1 hypothetical protein I6I83_04935 [Fusobacterium canifelinum]
MEDKQEEILEVKKEIKKEKTSIVKILVGLIIKLFPYILGTITAYFIMKDRINESIREIWIILFK